jgi:prevent-host-death family protein
MPVATTPVEVGVRDLKNNLSRYLDRVSDGLEIVVTERGRPVARLLRIDESADRLADLIAAGLVRPPRTRGRRLPPPIPAAGSVSDLVADQRR